MPPRTGDPALVEGTSTVMPHLDCTTRATRRSAVAVLLIGAMCSTVIAAIGVGVGASASAAGHSASDYAPSMRDRAADELIDEANRLPAELVASIEADLGLTPAEYVAEAAAAVDGVDVVASLTGRGVDVLGARMEGTELVVNLGSEADRAAVADAGATAEIGEPDALDISSIRFLPAFDLNGGEGYAWTASGATRQCSIGLPGYRISDGRPVALTAGHCVGGMGAISGAVRQLTQSAPAAGGTLGQPIGSPGASAFGSGFDGGLITLAASDVTPRAGVVTWGGSNKAPRSTATTPVTGLSAAIVGANLCKSGSRTGWSCGTVRAVDRDVNVGGSIVNSILADTCIQPGDSGGPALIGSVAVGINSSTSSAPCASADYISAFFPMRSAAGKASVQSQLGSVWEPALAVAAPSIDAITVPTGASAGSMSGRVTGTSVAIEVDGTQLLTVPVTGGSWTVDFADLAAKGIGTGTRELSAVAIAGKWSRASGAQTTVTFEGDPPRAVSGLLPADFVQR